MTNFKFQIKFHQDLYDKFKNPNAQHADIWLFGVHLKFKIQNSKLNSGFTLVEIIVAVFGFTMVAIGLVALVSGLLTGTGKQAGLLADTDQARKVAFAFTNEMRNLETSATGSYGLEQAGSQQIIFYSNIDKDAAPERIRYYVQNGKLYKGVIDPSGTPLVYTAAEQVSVAQNNIANGSGAVFYYYDGNYDGTSDTFLAQPVSVTAVKTIKILLKIYNKAGVTNASSYTVTSSGAVRNLKTNLAD